LLLTLSYAAPYDLLITQTERLGSGTSPAAEAMRQRLTDQFTERYNRAKELRAELDAIQAAQPPAQESHRGQAPQPQTARPAKTQADGNP
jgi:hypothetical protein